LACIEEVAKEEEEEEEEAKVVLKIVAPIRLVRTRID